MLFCESCQNMLYIKLSDKNSNTIINYCKHCGLESTAQNINIIEDVEKKENPDIINEFTKFDPTLPRVKNIPCPNAECSTNTENTSREIIYIKYNETNLSFMYLCPTCNTSWKI